MKPAGRPFQRAGVAQRLPGVDAVQGAELVEGPGRGERRQQVRQRGAGVGAQPAFGRNHSGEAVGNARAHFGRQAVHLVLHDLQQTDRGGGWVGAAAAHRRDLDIAAVVAAARRDKTDDRVRVGNRPAEQLVTEADQEGVVRAARRATGRLGVTAVRGPERLQGSRHAVGPVRRAACEYVRAAARLHQQGSVQKRKEIDHTRLFGQACTQEAGGTLAEVRGKGIEHGQAAQAETRVVKVRTALAAGEAAVGVLRGAQVVRVPGAQLGRQTQHAVGQAGGQAWKIRDRIHQFTIVQRTIGAAEGLGPL